VNAELLLDLFNRISDAPDALPRLRRFVLDLAVRGKLVEQDPSDESASSLVQRIRREKLRAIERKDERKEKPLLPLGTDERPFPIPFGWSWSQLAEIGFLNPRNTANDKTPASFVPMGMISAEYGVASTDEVRPWGEIKSGFTHFADGDVGLAKITPCFENCKSTAFRNLRSGIGAGTTELHVIRPVFVSADYVLIFLKSPHFIESGIPRMTGTAGQKRLPTEHFAFSPFPLPPLAEQHRIVGKVDELMALCDRLEAAQRERESRRDLLVASSHHHMNTGADVEALRSHAQFFIGHLPRVTARPNQVKQLRQTILNLAVRGELLAHDPSDEPIAEMLTEIREEQDRLIKQGAIPKRKQGVRPEQNPPPDCQSNWAVVSFGSLCNLVTSGSRGWAEFYSDSGPRFIRAQNIRFGRLLLDDLAHVSPPKKSEGTRTQVTKGDLLIVITGAGVTNPALLDQDLGQAYVSQHVALAKPTNTDLSPWLLLFLMADAGGRAELVRRAYGSGKPGLNLDNIRSLSVPLPPIREQQRILAKTSELLAICDQLEAQLATTQAEASRLLDSVLHSALNGQAEPQLSHSSA
jgi:type I restriction enzyme S subunit